MLALLLQVFLLFLFSLFVVFLLVGRVELGYVSQFSVHGMMHQSHNLPHLLRLDSTMVSVISASLEELTPAYPTNTAPLT